MDLIYHFNENKNETQMNTTVAFNICLEIPPSTAWFISIFKNPEEISYGMTCKDVHTTKSQGS